MAQFRYRAVSASGELLRGEMQAASADDTDRLYALAASRRFSASVCPRHLAQWLGGAGTRLPDRHVGHRCVALLTIMSKSTHHIE